MQHKAREKIRDEPDIRCLVTLYTNDELSLEEIAAKVGKSKRWVGKKLKGKIKPRPPKRKIVKHKLMPWKTTKDRDLLVIDLYAKGNGAYVISKKLNIGKRTVFRILNKHNVPIRAPGSPSTIDHKQVQLMYDSGLSMAAIAQDLGVSCGAISYHVEQPRDFASALRAIPHSMQDEVVRLYVEEKWSSYRIARTFSWTYQSVQRFIKAKGVSVGSLTKEWKESVQRGIKIGGSSLELALEKILQDLGVRYTSQYALGDFRYDFALNDGDVLIEVQGSYWHTKPQRRQRDRYKAKVARDHSKKLVIVWDFELATPHLVKNRIKNAICPALFDFKTCAIAIGTWQQTKELLNKHHYDGCGRAGVCIIVSYLEDIVGCAVFVTPTRQETANKQGVQYNQILELSRFVIHPAYQANCFATWFLAKAVKALNKHRHVKILVSFADATFGHRGTIYKAANWRYDGEAPASYWYYHRKQNKRYHKKTIWNRAKAAGVPEIEYAQSCGLLKVCGQKKLRYVYRLNQI